MKGTNIHQRFGSNKSLHTKSLVTSTISFFFHFHFFLILLLFDFIGWTECKFSFFGHSLRRQNRQKSQVVAWKWNLWTAHSTCFFKTWRECQWMAWMTKSCLQYITFWSTFPCNKMPMKMSPRVMHILRCCRARDLFGSQLQWPQEGLNCESLSYKVAGSYCVCNYFVYKRFAVRTLLWSLKFVIQTNLEHNIIAIWNLARSWSISTSDVYPLQFCSHR